MRVVCDNCGATYKIPESKLTRDVNKATCRKCGHRMLIKREAAPSRSTTIAKQNEDERTLVTSAADIERKAREQAASARAQVDPAASGIAGRPGGWDNDVPTAVQPDGPAPVLPPAPVIAPAPPAVVVAPPLPVAAAPILPAPAAPPAAAQQAAPPVAAAPAPLPRQARPAASAAFDPGGDLTWALLGVFSGIAGTLMLAANFSGSWIIRFAGVLLALGGAMLALFILVMGNRGRRKASVVVSFVLSAFFGVFGAGSVHLAYMYIAGANALAELTASVQAPPAATPPVAAPTPPPVATPEVVEAPPEVGAADAVPDAAEAVLAAEAPPEEVVAAAAPAAAAPAPSTAGSSSSRSSNSSSGSSSYTPTTRQASDEFASSSGSSSSRSSTSSTPSSSRSSTPSSSDSSSSGSVTTSRSPTTTSTTSSSRPSSSSSSSAVGLNTTVVDTMLRNNKNVKRCFIEEKGRTGELPSRVEVKITVNPSGSVPSARVATSRYKGTDLDVCLGDAIRGITFPPFDGEAVTLTYPFVL